jgi:hypothetical protein
MESKKNPSIVPSPALSPPPVPEKSPVTGGAGAGAIQGLMNSGIASGLISSMFGGQRGGRSAEEQANGNPPPYSEIVQRGGGVRGPTPQAGGGPVARSDKFRALEQAVRSCRGTNADRIEDADYKQMISQQTSNITANQCEVSKPRA